MNKTLSRICASAVAGLLLYAPPLLAEEVPTYLDRLDPVLHLHFDRAAGADSTTLGNGLTLQRPEAFSETSPSLVAGPVAWAGKGWDFSQADGPVVSVVNERQARVGDLSKTSGFTVSFWTKGEYSGRTSRMMAGVFDIGTTRTGLWGGSADYQNATMDSKRVVWDKQWHHVAVRVDFTEEIDNVSLWLDGERVANKTAFYGRPFNTRVGGKWYFGARNGADAGFDFGSLADIAVFDRPLQDAEISYLHAGPVFAGMDRTLYLPGKTTLDAVVPAGSTAQWTQLSGPESVVTGAENGAELALQFSSAGEYEFQVAAAGMASSVRVTVLANQPPLVHAGNGGVVDPSHPVVQLHGRVSDNGSDQVENVKLQWSMQAAPEGGEVRFSDTNSAFCDATFSQPGAYRLRLTADDGEFSSHSEVSMLVAEQDPSPSYLRLLNPLVLVDFEVPAVAHRHAGSDAIGNTGILVRESEEGLPVMVEGARDFTGSGWDFSQSDASIKVINGIHLKPLHVRDHPARSLSFWIKGDEDSRGYFSSFFGVMSLDKSGAVSHSLDRMPALSSSPVSVTDGEWHHVGLVVKTVEGEVRRSLYVDGSMVAENVAPWTEEWKPLSSPAIRHSQNIGSRGRSGADNLTGMLDDFALFDYALSEADIAYIIHGAGPGEKEALADLEKLTVDAGPNQYVELDSQESIHLSGQATSFDGITPKWSMVSGDGRAVFSDPDSPKTEVSFETDAATKAGRYHKFVLKLSLVDERGREMVGDPVTVLLYPERAPAPRQLTSTPAPGEHPRVLFAEADLPELRHKATTVPVAMRAVEAMRKRAGVLDDPTKIHGAVYAALLDGRRGNVAEVEGGNWGGLFTTLMEAAYVAWLGDGGESDKARMKELGQVFAQAAGELSATYTPIYENALTHDVNWAVGLCYDLLHDEIDEEQRAVCRKLLARMTAFRQSVGTDEEAWSNSTNWRGYHDHFLMCLLAIEGEDGFNEMILDNTERKNSVFQSEYGIFESGLPHEGYAYYTFGMQWMSVANLAIARRAERENLFATSRFYPSIETAFRLMDPDRSGIRSHHDVVGGPSGSGLISLPPRHVMAAKYIWSEDRLVDYVYAALAENLLAGEDRAFSVFEAIWGEPLAWPEQSLAEAAGDLDPVKFCPDRGAVLARDTWREDGVRLDFRCRMDKYKLGHQHADVNSFELWSHQREWIIDRGKFGGVTTDVASTVLIDGVAGPSAKRFAWPSFPGRFVAFEATDEFVRGVGDAKPFYDYCFSAPRSDPGDRIKDHGLTWSDFYFPRSGEKMPGWMQRMPVDLDGYGNANGIYSLNPVKRALRSVALAKGDHPFVIVADDIDKDGQAHDYQWIANTCIGERMVEVSSSQTDLVLRHAADSDGGPRLLVRVLRADGQSGAIHLDRDPVVIEKNKIEAVRIVIPCRTIAPDYRVLLYPFLDGDPLPDTSWNGTEDTLRVTIGDTTRIVRFADTGNGKVIAGVE